MESTYISQLDLCHRLIEIMNRNRPFCNFYDEKIQTFHATSFVQRYLDWDVSNAQRKGCLTSHPVLTL